MSDIVKLTVVFPDPVIARVEPNLNPPGPAPGPNLSGGAGWSAQTTFDMESDYSTIDFTGQTLTLAGMPLLENVACVSLNLAGLLFDPTPASLSTLYCGSNQLTSLPALPASLSTLSCDGNQLTSLPALPASLSTLYCGSNQLTSLPALPASLSTLYCGSNQLTSLPALPASLSTLYCGSNQLTSLPALPASLSNLSCDGNQLTSSAVDAAINAFYAARLAAGGGYRYGYFQLQGQNPSAPPTAASATARAWLPANGCTVITD